MKPTSPISLLLFLQITTGVRAAPIPLHNDCLHYASCDSPIRDLLSEFSLGSKHTPPATKLANPHFPSHQIDNSPPHPSPQHPALPPPPPTHDEKPFNNAPVTPPSSVSPNTALSAEVPLESHYLQSLSQNPTESLAAKPTSALPELREEDLKRYQKEVSADLKKPSGRIHKEHRLAMQAQAEQISAAYNCPHMAIMNIEEGRGAWKASRSREYSDLLVIGIVVLFLCAVVAVEAAEKISDLRQAIFGRSEGAIRLEDDEALFIVKKPFYLQPAPPPRYKIRSLQKGTLQKPAEWSEDDTDVESFKYDSDAAEKC